MRLACLVCDLVADVSLAAEAHDYEQQSARSKDVPNVPLEPENALIEAKKVGNSTRKRAQRTRQSISSDEASRCSVCDGFYHIPCLLTLVGAVSGTESTLAAPFRCPKCRTEAKKDNTKTNTVQGSTVLPLMVPEQALPYLKTEHSLEKGENDLEELKTVEMEKDKVMDNESDQWRVFSTSVEVCTTCRQVEITDADRGSCGKCNKTKLHLRCVQTQAEQVSVVEAQVTDKSSRKRRRAPSAVQAKAPTLPPPVGAATLNWCAPCVTETNKQQMEKHISGLVETRTIALLVQTQEDSPVQWWKTCRVCKERFCLEEFCDPQTADLSLDEVLLKAPLTENDADWSCSHCAVGSHELVTVLICDGCDGEFDMAALDPPLLEAPDGDWFCGACSANTAEQVSGNVKLPMEVVTVLICDGCDGEYDMASIQPPLANVPEGDWFCNNCVAASSKFTNVKTADNATLVPVTLLICDACEGEFDMAALDPPLTKVPSGNWFCSGCTAAQPPQKAGSTRRYGNKVGMPKRRAQSNTKLAAVGGLSTQPTPLSQIGAQHEVMTVLICDGCEREFVPSALNPPVLEIPEGDWYCPTCSPAKASDVQTCAGCDVKFQAGGSVAGRLHRRSGTVDGVMLCEACRNVQVDCTRRRPTPITNVVHTANDVSVQNMAAAGPSRKRSRWVETDETQNLLKRVKSGVNGLQPTASNFSAIEPSTSQRASHSVSVDDDTYPRIPVPNPVTIVASSASLRNDFDRAKLSNGWDFTNPTVVIANPGDVIDTNNISDGEAEDDVIYIICDVCFKEFKMADVLGTDDASAIPARPWYCAPCFRGLKRNRKRRKRFSQQMVLEMQVYGRLLRPTAAKVVDLNTAASLGKPPNSRDGQRKLYELVGKSVGVFLQWDKQWVMGRVMVFQATHPAMHHIVHFDDGVVASLPLYAFPLVIGTRTMLYVKVPAMQNRWWPAQVLRLNPLARNILLPTHDEEISAHANFRLVRIFASNGERVETTQYVSCWVPKYLCRSMKRFVPRLPHQLPTGEAMEDVNTTLEKSLARANYETQAEISCLDYAFQHLLTTFRQTIKPVLVDQSTTGVKPTDKNSSDSSRSCAQIAEALVAKTIVVTAVGSNNQGMSPGTFTINSFDKGSRRHTILAQDSYKENAQVMVDLLQGSDGIVYHFEDPVAFSELAIMLELSGPDARNSIPGEFYSKELLEKAIVRETGAGKAISVSTTRADSEGNSGRTCHTCMLGPEELLDETIDANETANTGVLEEDLVVCAKCNRRFHATCCDPPHAPLSLVNPENGEVLVSDLKTPFVCSDCTLCAGCHCQRQNDKQTTAVTTDQQDTAQHPNNCNPELEAGRNCSHRWSQWRLPLRAAALCAKCIPYYKTNRFCSVCDLVLDDDQLSTDVDLLTCSTCNHWVHAECEPDPHPAFHTLSSNSEFALDIIVDLSDIQSSVLQSGGSMGITNSAKREQDSQVAVNVKTPVGSRSPSEDRDMLPNAKGVLSRDIGLATSAKMAEEEFAHSLQFSATYDPKMLHNYECLTCRKVRMLHVLHRLGREDKLDLFKEPVTEAIAPTYFDVIKSPMDLSTMRHNVLDGKYTRVNFRGFRDDFELMCLNAVTFNSKERDFLIWREAWRFYGQGQRIFRQTAPKSRMKQRGGRHYDALLVAAKRQLPNNSALAGGKKQFNGDPLGDDGEYEDDDEIDDEEDGDTGSDAGTEAQKRGNTSAHNDSSGAPQPNGSASALNLRATAANSDTNSKLPKPKGEPTRDPVAVKPTTDLVSSSVPPASENRQVVASDTIAYQTILRTDKLTSRLPMFQITQTRPSAHTYCWMDMCAVCGSAGLDDEFVFCVDCGEGFHSFCVPGMSSSRLQDNDQLRAYWRCPNCKMCELCGQPGCVGGAANKSSSVPATAGNVESKGPTEQPNGTAISTTTGRAKNGQLVACAHCDRSYHGSCLSPSIDLSAHFKNKKREGAPPAIYCASCVTCTNCASNHIEGEKEQAARLERTYSYARDTCFRCYNRKERETQALLQRTKALTQIWTAAARKRKIDAEKCPLCDRKWDADHEELMQCDACDCWVHPPCDALLKAEPKRYQKLVNDPNAVYICAACRPKEREHLAGKVLGGDKWRCQLLIDNIQRKRSQCESGWNEARAQMEQNEHWKRLADHTSVYLYVLRLGEECLRNFSFRSLNFQGDWFRLTKQQELDDAGLILPEWLMRKASRYLRFKRYVRGPRAAARRRERKTQSFYSKQGVGLNTQKDASAICPIVSEAASCAALLACVHLLYGWRPLPEVVLHLLSIDKDNAKGLRAGERQKLGEPLLTRLRMGENNDTDTSKPKMTLEQEVAAIKEQYDRRAGKRHLVREPDSDLMLFGFGDVAAETKVPATSSKLHVATKDLEQKEHAASSVDSNETKTVIPPSVKRAGDGQSSPTATLMQSSTHGPKPMVHLTTVSPLQGWPTKMPEISDDDNSVDEADTEGFSEAIMSLPFEDSRFCALCYMIGDNTACGRLLYTEPETWVHVNCALWSMEVFEDVSGVLHKVQKARNRSRLIRCDACGLMGATIGCSILRCTTHYHFPCAVDAGVAFLPNGETCCPHPSHLDSMARRLEVAGNITGKPLSTPTIIEVVDASNKMDKDDGHSGGTTREAAENGTALTPNKDDSVHSANGSAEEDDKDGKSSTESVVSTPESTAVAKDDQSTISTAEREPVMKVENADSAITPSQQVNSNDIVTTAKPVPVVQSEHVLPVINPRPEPRRRLFSDPPIIVIDVRKKRSDAKRGIKPRPMCYRVGALTVHTLGHVFVGNTSFHTRSAIYPLGFRSSRIFWSTRHLAKRCLYECVISSTEIEERRARQKDCGTNGGEAGVNDSVQQWSRPRAVFKIVPSDDKERPIVASSAEDALIELRSRVVALYEEHKSFSASPRGSEQGQASTVVEAERNPFLKRSSWFSFALSGDYFFGFGLPEVTRYIEELPYAATAAVGRRAIARKLQQQQQRQGQSPLAASSATTWANTSRKRSHDTMELSPAAVSSTLPAVEEDEKLYEFSQVLPSAEEFQTAQRVMEQLVRAEQRARQSSGSARTDGFEGNRLFGAPKKQKTMPRRQALNKEATNEPVAGVSNGNGGSGGVAMDLEHLPITMQYRELRRRPFDERLLVRKSSIHGYGLFLKEPVSEGQMIVEYQGHMIGQRVADERERRYEEQGIGSCYMFRLDESTIIDATRCGNLARFINHSCDPKAFARVVSVEGGEKKIVIFAKRAIAVGDEVTYDYKFPIEDEAIRCDCNAPNCIGRMN